MRTAYRNSVRESQRMVLILALGLTVGQSSFAQTAEEYRRRALEASRTKSWDEAIAGYHHALDLGPNDALTHYNLALALKYKGEARQVVDEFESALRLRPNWADAHFGLGAAWLDLDDLPAARKELDAAVELDPKNPNAHRVLERVAAQQNDLALAQSGDACVQLGLVLNQRNDTTAAINVFHELIRREPNFAEAHNNLGLVYLQSGDFPAARTEFSQAVRIKPGDAEAHYNLGLALQQLGKDGESRAEFERAYDISPELRNAIRP